MMKDANLLPPPEGFKSWLDWLVELPDIDLTITGHRLLHPESAPERWQISEAAKASLSNMREAVVAGNRDRETLMRRVVRLEDALRRVLKSGQVESVCQTIEAALSNETSDRQRVSP